MHAYALKLGDVLKVAPIIAVYLAVTVLAAVVFGIVLVRKQLHGSFPEDSLWWKSYMVNITFEDNKTAGLEIIPCTFGPDALSVRLLIGKDKEDFLAYLELISGIIADPGELELLWYGWCVMKGPGWLKRLSNIKYPLGEDDGASVKRLLAVRDGFTCEAHHELISTFLRLACEGRTEVGEGQISRIQQLQKEIVV